MRKLNLIVFALIVLFLTSCLKEESPRTQSMEDNEISELLLNLNAQGKNVDTAFVNNVAFYFLVEEEGSGPNVAYGDSLVIKYDMSKLNLVLIDSSADRFEDGQWKFKFTEESAFITGFKQALLLSKKGSSMIFILPSKLAYGEYGAPPVIGPYEPLLLGLQLDDIVPPID